MRPRVLATPRRGNAQRSAPTGGAPAGFIDVFQSQDSIRRAETVILKEKD